MPTIRMTHQGHGATHVYSEQDALEHEKIGWKRDAAKAEPETLIGVPGLLKLTEDEQLAAQYEAKFGAKPHHRMKRQSIEAALRE